MKKRFVKGQAEGDVDLTPMLDIVFIMLIFFIVTATFVQEKGIDLLRPDPDQQQQQTIARSPVSIQIAQNNDVFIGVGRQQRRIDIGAVRANVERELVELQTSTVLITAHPEADVDTTVSVVDQSRQAGAQISLRPAATE